MVTTKQAFEHAGGASREGPPRIQRAMPEAVPEAALCFSCYALEAPLGFSAQHDTEHLRRGLD
eukprot:2713616-Alexandrium_andersonii.AAC.1